MSNHYKLLATDPAHTYGLVSQNLRWCPTEQPPHQWSEKPVPLPIKNGGLNLEIKGGQVSAEIWGKINIKMPNLNHRLF
jgi:hypothetical protein